MFRAMHPDVFTDSWAAAWGRELNASSAYRDAAADWEGAVALRMGADVALGIPQPRTVWLDLHHGLCRDARAATETDLGAAKYVIEAEAAVWKELLAGRLSPIKGGRSIDRPPKSGRRDLNPRPLQPHCSALPDCATSRTSRSGIVSRRYSGGKSSRGGSLGWWPPVLQTAGGHGGERGVAWAPLRQ